MPAPGWPRAFGPSTTGEWIVIDGMVIDGAGNPVPDALVETWQRWPAEPLAQPAGGPELSPAPGFTRVPTDNRGEFTIQTVRPGPVRGPGGAMLAPHLMVNVFARGLLAGLVTRLYFPDTASEADPILALVPPSRRSTLIAVPNGAGRYRFDIILQGPRETVFFDA